MQNLFQPAALERADYAEEIGVDSSSIKSFLEECRQQGYNINNLIVGRHGKVAAQCCKKPYNKQFAHTSFSSSKPIVTVAIGFAINEGLLRLDTTMGEIFADKLNEKQMEKVGNISVDNLLSMRPGIALNLFASKTKDTWLDVYCKFRKISEPNGKFLYMSENTYILSRMLTVVTGLTVSQYLKPRLFEPLGIETPFWETDSEGYEAGGWGLYLKIEDMAKIAQCFLDKGMWNKVSVIPSDWIEKMITPITGDLQSLYAKGLGYGYSIWGDYDNSYYRFEGFFGQYVLIFPKHDAFVVMNSGDSRQYIIFPLLEKYFPEAFKDPEGLNVSSEQIERFNEYLDNYWYPIVECGPRNFASEAGLSGKTYKLFKRKFGTIQAVSSMFEYVTPPGYMDNLKFDFYDGYAEMSWTEKNYGENTIKISLDGEIRYSTFKLAENEMHTAAFGRWLPDGKLRIQIIPMEVPEVRTFTIKFKKNRISLRQRVDSSLEGMIRFELIFKGIPDGVFVRAISKIGGVVGSLVFYPQLMSGFKKKDKEKTKNKDE